MLFLLRIDPSECSSDILENMLSFNMAFLLPFEAYFDFGSTFIAGLEGRRWVIFTVYCLGIGAETLRVGMGGGGEGLRVD
jgi:hypothetical protein